MDWDLVLGHEKYLADEVLQAGGSSQSSLRCPVILSIIAFGAGPIARTVLLPAAICAIQKRKIERLKLSGQGRSAVTCAARQRRCVPAFSPHQPPASAETVSGDSGNVLAAQLLLMQNMQSMQTETQ